MICLIQSTPCDCVQLFERCEISLSQFFPRWSTRWLCTVPSRHSSSLSSSINCRWRVIVAEGGMKAQVKESRSGCTVQTRWTSLLIITKSFITLVILSLSSCLYNYISVSLCGGVQLQFAAGFTSSKGWRQQGAFEVFTQSNSETVKTIFDNKVKGGDYNNTIKIYCKKG